MATHGENGQSRMAEVVRNNSVPLALMGLGLGWLMFSSVRGGEQRSGEHHGATEGGGYGASGYQSATGYSEYGDREESTVAGARRRVQDVAGKAGRMAGGARQRAGQMASQAMEQLSGVGERMRGQAGDIADRSRHMFQDHPLMLGTMALVVGAAIGASLPRSRAENRAYGGKDPMRGETLEKAKRVAARAAEATRDEGMKALERVREAIREEAERQNLTGEPPSRLPH